MKLAAILLLQLWSFLTFQGYEIHMFDSVLNYTAYLGNTTENFFKVSNLKMGHNYSFTVQARCLFSGQMCGEPAMLLYDELGAGKEPPLSQGWPCQPAPNLQTVQHPCEIPWRHDPGLGFMIKVAQHCRQWLSFQPSPEGRPLETLGTHSGCLPLFLG